MCIRDSIVTYYGDDKYDKSTVNGNITVNKKAATLIVEDLVDVYKRQVLVVENDTLYSGGTDV